MAFTPKPWQTGRTGGTPETAAALIDLEVRVTDYTDDVVAGLPIPVSLAAFGMVGDGTVHPLAETYPLLADAQAVYPFVTSLSQSVDWAALTKALLASAEAGAGSVIVPIDAHLALNEELDYPEGARVQNFGKLDWGTLRDGAAAIRVTGIEGAQFAIAHDVAYGDRAVTLGTGLVAAAGIQVGDRLRLGSTALYNPVPDSKSVDVRIGESVIVEAIDSDTLTLNTPVLSRSSSSDPTGATGGYLVADGAFVSKITTHKNASITGTGRLIGGGVGAAHYGLVYDRCENFYLGSGLSIEGFEHRVVWVQSCFDSTIERLAKVDGGLGTTDLNYGISLTFGCENITIEGCRKMRHLFHAIEQGGTTARSGINRGIVIRNNRAYSTRAACFESHSGTEGCLIRDNWMIGCQQGTSFRGSAMKVINNRIVRPTALAIYGRNQTTAPTQFLIHGNQLVGCARGAIRVGSDEQHSIGGGASVAFVTITDNQIHECGASAIVVSSTDTWRFTNVLISGNVINKPGMLAYANGPADAPDVDLIADATPGQIDPGARYYATANVSAAGETLTGPTAFIVTDAAHASVAVTAIPLGPSGTTSRRIYRSLAGGTSLKLLAVLGDNTTTTYTDTTPDAGLGALAAASAASNASAIVVQKATGVVVGPHVISGLDGSGNNRSAVKLTDVTDFSIGAIQQTWTSSTAGHAFDLNSVIRGRIHGGSAGAARSGLVLDDASSNITFRDIDLSQTAIPVSLGAGSGHVVRNCTGAHDYGDTGHRYTLGNGAASSFAIPHGSGVQYPIVRAFDTTTTQEIGVTVTYTDANNLTVSAEAWTTNPPASNSIQVLVMLP